MTGQRRISERLTYGREILKTRYGSTRVMTASNVARMPKMIVAMASMDRLEAILCAASVLGLVAARLVVCYASGASVTDASLSLLITFVFCWTRTYGCVW